MAFYRMICYVKLGKVKLDEISNKKTLALSSKVAKRVLHV